MTTSGNTTEGSVWHPPSGRPTDEDHAPTPPIPGAYVPGPYAQGPYPGYAPVHVPTYGAPRPGKGLALGTLWTGIGSLVLAFLSVGVLGILRGAVGMVLGMVTLRRTSRGTATGSETATFGMALSLVAIVLGALLLMTAWPALVDAFEQGYEQGWEQGSQP